MPHITLSKKTNCNPSLEYYSDGSADVRRVTIEKNPFKIGRADSSDLRIESAEVSREHAEIFERNGMWLVRDLGSTNGTHVNGKQVKETLLSDRDILRVAETELTFIASAASQFQRMVTQPVQSKQRSSAPCTLAPEVAAMRVVTEATLWQAIPVKLAMATSLRHGAAEACFALVTLDGKKQPILASPHLVGERYRELERRRALELAAERSTAQRLFLPIVSAEIESPRRVLAGLKHWQSLLPTDWELGITISLPTDVDILRIGELYREARDHDLLVAFDEFQGNGSQVMHLKSLLPDYLVLADSMTKDLTTTRQPLRRLESLMSVCDELAIKPVLPGHETGPTLALCQEVGFDLVLSTASRSSAPPAEMLVASV